MHDIKYIRQDPEGFDAALKRRGLEAKAQEILALDEKKRAQQTSLQELLSKRNGFAKHIGEAKRSGADASQIMAEAKANNDAIAALEENLSGRGELESILESLPNLPADDVPQGADEKDNKEIRKWGEPRKFDFAPKLHDDIGTALGLMDFEGAAKLSGARFVVLKGALARMERALASFFLDHNVNAGYTEMVPPFLVKDAAAYGTGQLPKFKDDLFRVASSVPELPITKAQFHTDPDGIIKLSNPTAVEWVNKWKASGYKCKVIYDIDNNPEKIVAISSNDFWLIPTAEVPLTNLVADSILEEAALPMRMTAYTPCFRSEAGSAGRDTKGMIRQHQFSKVEMVSITTPEQSVAEHERMTANAEAILQKLGLPYRTVLLCTGDMGFSAEKTYDIEVWMPGQDAYREISSCSNCGGFQARRMKARFKRGKENLFVHTLNGSGLPIGRTMVAIIENYQHEDGSITVPEALVPYMGGLTVIAA
ncbi:MAG: serine--tRNA ligase [Alphaproteobacteria bacterium]|nr:serine--tRNA ligase [Alphaproteobacteria bacterium]